MHSKEIVVEDGSALYQANVFSREESDEFLAQLLSDVPWRQDFIKIFGRLILQPRLTAWMGDPGARYRYSGISLEPEPWCRVVQMVRNRVESITGHQFNSVLLNHYRNGLDSMGWHRDNEKELGAAPVIASVSFGAQRRFLLRRYATKSDKKIVQLEHGSLFIMSGALQQHWEHSLPKTAKSSASSIGPRVNLTFRQVAIHAAKETR
jgi:alkylated DNA repair dioxygenase AlkB